ncbi:hypothetical protein R1sor_016033 [Riccia sorocarpa]|uniref:Fe2OG dioxygenase domain-containing protein n=1 Tax=Riccia sorocarpa TaxID=122646 RepID=A0ABD3HHV9_9MARC
MGAGEQHEEPLDVVDLSNPNKAELAKAVRRACIDVGFFYLINHGIDQKLMDEVLVQSKRFFDLPTEEKMKVKFDKNHRGYTPMAEEHLDPENSTQGDSKEGYYIGWDVSADDPMASKPLHGPNQWPSEDVLPGWRTVMEKYYFEVLKLGHRVASLIALSLELRPDYFEKMFTVPMVVMRPLHYAAVHSSPQEGRFGSGAHSDYGLLTFLLTDENSGLQICKDKEAKPQVWQDVAPRRGAYIVNLGDMLERWTNGLYRSTLHRVVTKGVDRYSFPYFYEPNFDTLVECLPTCCSPTNPARYPPLTSGEHLLGKYHQTHTGFDVTAKPHGFENLPTKSENGAEISENGAEIS